MHEKDFFSEVEHIPITLSNYQVHIPVFYRDMMYMSVSTMVTTEKLTAFLPSKRLNPYRLTPRHSALTITAYQYRDSDIGPYNEVAISIPVVIDKKTPLFTGSLRRMPEVPMVYVHRIPVTSQIALDTGIAIAGYPKIIADIEFVDEGDWVSCVMKESNQQIITLRGRKLQITHTRRNRISPLTHRGGYIIRGEIVFSERGMGTSKNRSDIKIELGDHQVSHELREMGLGKVLAYRYCPQTQLIFTPVLESLSV